MKNTLAMLARDIAQERHSKERLPQISGIPRLRSGNQTLWMLVCWARASRGHQFGTSHSGSRGDGMKKLLLVPFLLASLSCFAQVVISNGTATVGSQTDMQTVAPGPPQIVPSNVALPGSGPPVGAPLTNSNTNDARTGGVVQAYNPAAVYERPASSSSSESITGSESLPAAGVAAGIPFNMGLQSFSGSASSGQTSAPPLGDIARQYRKENHLSARMFTNDSISQMSPGQPLPQGKETAQEGPRDIQQEMAKAAAIPPMSAGSVQASNANSSAQPNMIDQTKRTPSSEANQTAAANPAPAENEQQAQNEESGNSRNLPASGSELPLLALLGIAIAGGGGLYRLFHR